MKTLELEQMENIEGGFVLLCAAGGPVVFGACLTVALVFMATAAY
jgi:hypothetical protein